MIFKNYRCLVVNLLVNGGNGGSALWRFPRIVSNSFTNLIILHQPLKGCLEITARSWILQGLLGEGGGFLEDSWSILDRPYD